MGKTWRYIWWETYADDFHGYLHGFLWRVRGRPDHDSAVCPPFLSSEIHANVYCVKHYQSRIARNWRGRRVLPRADLILANGTAEPI
jgi:hypothetical protein